MLLLTLIQTYSTEAQEGGGDQGGCPGRRPGGGAPGVMGVRRQGCRQGNGELVVVWWVACGKNVKSY
jgi:hypothetical protein